MKKTGRSSVTASASMPPMSWHSLGATTTIPGTPSSSFSSDWLWVGP